MTCEQCGQEIPDGKASVGMNMPGVTDGPVYWCRQCRPPGTAEDIIESITSFIDPPKEQS